MSFKKTMDFLNRERLWVLEVCKLEKKSEPFTIWSFEYTDAWLQNLFFFKLILAVTLKDCIKL